MLLIPKNQLIPIAIAFTQQSKRCADSWTDSDVAIIRAELPLVYHAVPLDELRRQLINIRKSGVEGMKVSGTGPRKNARKFKNSPSWYIDYLNSDSWNERKKRWLDFWKKCCVCANINNLDVHHNDYSRLGDERQNDCVVLCRSCHNLFHEKNDEGPGLFDE